MAIVTDDSASALDGLIDENLDAPHFRVSRRAFTSQEVFDAELDRFWRRAWLYLGHESEVAEPGDFVTRTVAGRPLIFVRDEVGDVRVFVNACPHRGTTVCRQEAGNTRFFQCFYHAWTFRNSGQLVSMPGEDAYEGIDIQSRYGLVEVPRVESYRGFVFISLTDRQDDIVTYLGGAAECLDLIADQSPDGVEVVAGSHQYVSRTNWKLAVENALDQYHFMPTHTTFTEYRKSSGFAARGTGGWSQHAEGRHVVLESSGLYGRAGLTWEPAWGEDERQRIEDNRVELVSRLGDAKADRIASWSRNTFIFPNLLTFDFIGLSLRVLEPVAPGVTQVRASFLGPKGEPEAARKLRLNQVVMFMGPGGFATPDDVEAQQCAQEGYGATADDPRDGVAWNDVSRGLLREIAGEANDMNDEAHLRTFWRHWAKELTR